MQPKVLVTEPLDQAGIDLLEQTCHVTLLTKPSMDDLVSLIPEFDALIVRSATKVSAPVLEAGTRLKVVGRAGTGVDNIDLDAATRQGIVVVNAPTSNTVAVAEHTMAMMLCLARHIPAADSSAHAGRWERKALMGTELRDKTLGLVGLGHVGRAVTHRAHAFEMHLIAYDPFVSPERAARLNVEMVDLDTLLARADYVSLHTPCTDRTRGMIAAQQLAMMKPTAYLINCARGGLIVDDDLIAALSCGQIAGAAADVYAQEPNIPEAFQASPKLVLTPHLGASTREAQSGAALEVARQVVTVLRGRPPRYPVNITALSSDEMAFLAPYLDLATRMGRFYAQLAANNLTHIEMEYAGEIAERDSDLLISAVLTGLLSESGHGHVNIVNARLVAQECGLVLSQVRTSEAQGFAGLVTLRTRTTRASRELSGAIIRGQPHILRIDGYWLDFVPQGHFLVDEHLDRPGIVGQMGTLLGDAGVNISFVQLGRETKGGVAVMVLGLDEAVDAELISRIEAMPDIRAAYAINL